jgi:hypothetical protein
LFTHSPTKHSSSPILIFIQPSSDTLPSSSGLGEAICLKFAAEGCNIAINYVSSEQKAEELKKRIENEFGVKVLILKAVG